MPATTLDSMIFRDIFTTAEMRQVFSDEYRTACYLEIEAALARVQGRLGIIPQEAARRDRRQVQGREHRLRQAESHHRAHRLSDPRRGAADRGALRQGARRVVPLGRDHAGHHRHRDHHADPRRRSTWSRPTWRAIAAALADLARRYRDTPMAGRSNLQQAVPLTFGFKCACLLAAMQRHRERLKELRPRVLVGEFARRGRHACLARHATASRCRKG